VTIQNEVTKCTLGSTRIEYKKIAKEPKVRFESFYLGVRDFLERRLTDLDLEALGVLDRLLLFFFLDRRLGLRDFTATSSSPSAALGALGVLARRRELDLRLEAFGVLDRRRLDLREAERLLDDLGVFDRFFLERRRRLGVLLFFGVVISTSSTSDLGAFGVLALRREADRDRLLLALGVLDRRRDTDLLFEDLGVLDRFFLERRRLGVLAFFTSPSAAAFGALGVLARLADLRLEALGVLDRLLLFFFADRRLGFRDLLATSSSATSALGALGVLALRREVDRRFDALGVLERLLDFFLDRRRLGVRDFLAETSSPSGLGAFGVLAFLRDLERLLEAFGVLDLRLVRREVDRLLLDFGVLERRLDRRRFGVLDFLATTSSSAAAFFGALGVLALRRDPDRRLEALGVLDLRLVRREADLLRLDLGVLERRLDFRRLGVLDFFAETSSPSGFGALGVLALRREPDRRFEAFGVLDRREVDRREAERLFEDFGVLDRFLDRLRRGVLAFLTSPSSAFFALGAFGVLARRFAALRPLDALGVLDLRRLRRRRRAEVERLGSLGVRARRALLRLVAFAFLEGATSTSGWRARFLIPRSLFLFSSISALYASLAVT